MNNFIFENPTKIYFGKGCVKEYLTCLVKHYGKNVMFAYGNDSIRNQGIYDEIIKSLTKAEKNVVEFSGICENPTYEKVQEGAKLAKENKIDFILAVGGGSVMDCCKAVSMAAVYDGDLWNDFFARHGIMEFDPVPLGAVVTETETGSEMNGRAVITNKALKVRTGRDYPKCNPRFALIDPAYSCNASRRQMVSDGFDRLSRIMETYFSKPDEDNVSDDIAEALMKNVIQNLRAAIINPKDYTARSNLIWDAAMAENRILKLGKQADFQCHQMEHQIAAYTNCNQGEGLAVLHPVYYRHIYKNGRSKFKKFAVNVWGISDLGKTEEETACEGVEALAGFIKEVGLPATLRDIGADENTDLKRIADSCILSAGSYKQMTHKEILEIFQECYYGGKMMRKKMMKKVTAVLAGVVLAIGLTACGSQGSGNNTAEVRQEEEGVISEDTQESSALPEQETGDQSDAVQVQQETTSQTEQQAEGDMDTSAEDTDQTSAEGGKTLVVYYSATGNTESVAGYIAAATDADIFVLEPVEPYSSEDLDWTDKDSRVTREHENEDERNVELVSATVDNWESYDTVFIGYPIWWHIAAWPVDGFIAANDFTGKTVIPFCTSSSSDLGESGELLEEAAGTGNWLEGERFSSSASEETVRAWVEGLNL